MRRNNLYLLLMTFIALTIITIALACAMVVQARNDDMIEQQQIEAQRLREKQEQLLEEGNQFRLSTLAYAETEAEEAFIADEETNYDGKGGLECEFKEDVERLACVIYQEAGGDACCDLCRKRVADVVLNRVKDPRFKGTTIEEILIDGDPAPQWGLYSVTGIIWPEKASLPEETHAVERARETAFDVLEGNHSDLTEDYIWCAEFPQGTDVVECCGIYFGK